MSGAGICEKSDPQGRLDHSIPQGLPAHWQALLGQVLGGESGPKISIALANSRQNLPLQSRGQLAVRGPATEPMNDSSIAVLAHADQHPPHLAVGSFQPLRGRYLRQMLL